MRDINDFNFGIDGYALDVAIEGITDVMETTDKQDGEDSMQKEEQIRDAEETTLATCAFIDLTPADEISEASESFSEQTELSSLFGVAMERTIVRLDRKDRMRHLTKAATLQAARKANDPKFKKLMTLWKMERAIEAEFDRKYRSQAIKIANEKIKQYNSNGIRKMQKPNQSTIVGKGKVSTQVAQRAVNQSKRMFSNSSKPKR